ncbi:hypothetical protein FSP39_020954 [Pinctada imbricata]|uniref:Uncharacterized protein n=1 Tax=Pinctada imbricata TaxID=66713 RepID=A0AA88Y4Z0_PINIB|nr:hypothetical protein FSP39_020954 [Pinctada imbricata]
MQRDSLQSWRAVVCFMLVTPLSINMILLIKTVTANNKITTEDGGDGANVVLVNRGIMAGSTEDPLRHAQKEMCKYECGELYFRCKIKTCAIDDDACTNQCTEMFRGCFFTCDYAIYV